MVNSDPIYDVIIVGAGIAGLTAARKLQSYGRRILVLEKSRGVGGRMATRRSGDAAFDHGAQFITARENNFINWLNTLEERGVVAKWFSGESGEDRHPRWRGVPGMNAMAKHLSKGIDIRLESKVIALEKQGYDWHVHFQNHEYHITSTAILLTPPVPQTLELLEFLQPSMSEKAQTLLTKFTYERCLAVLARLTEPTHLSPPGFLRKPSTNISWLADNQLKGVSKVPAVTIHATADFSLRHWQENREHITEMLLQEASEHLNLKIKDCQVHGWKYSKPQYIHELRSFELFRQPHLILAGDAFGGPRVEGASLSGWDAAERLEEEMRSRG
ncbi:MAG: FAD-dependent oxidoreductase [Desulfocapsaceae bacterium]|nr:FAD-dependent oxidoreductase [Desulfocapsaceae bacterium]